MSETPATPPNQSDENFLSAWAELPGVSAEQVLEEQNHTSPQQITSPTHQADEVQAARDAVTAANPVSGKDVGVAADSNLTETTVDWYADPGESAVFGSSVDATPRTKLSSFVAKTVFRLTKRKPRSADGKAEVEPNEDFVLGSRELPDVSEDSLDSPDMGMNDTLDIHHLGKPSTLIEKEEPIADAWQIIRANGISGGPTPLNIQKKSTKAKRKDEEKAKKTERDDRFSAIKPIIEDAVNNFHDYVRGMEPDGTQVKVYRLVRADDAANSSAQKSRTASIFRQTAYGLLEIDKLATIGREIDGRAATLTEFTTGKRKEGDRSQYKVVEETNGWVLDSGTGYSMDVGRIKTLLNGGGNGRSLESLTREERWLANILLHGKPMDRDAYSALGARGDGTFSRVRITGTGDNARAEIVGAQSDQFVVSADGRSWAGAYPLAGSNGSAYIVLSDNDRSGYPDDLLARSCVRIAEEVGYDAQAFERRINDSLGGKYAIGDPVHIINVLTDWLEHKQVEP